jgi:hypothetical protein
MLSRILVLPLLVIFPATVCAQTATTPTEAPAASSDSELAPLPQETDPALASSNPTQSNSALDQPITKIANTMNGCAVLDKNFPGLRAHPMYEFFKAMSLNQVAAMSHGQITAAMLAQAQADLAALDMQVRTAATVPVATAAPMATAAPVALVH